MNQQIELGYVGVSAGRVVPLFERETYSFLDLMKELKRCALQSARLSATTYTTFFVRDRSQWRKRMGRRRA